MDIQRNLETIQSTLGRYKPALQANEVDKSPGLQYLVAEESHLEAERNSEGDLLPDGCRSRAELGSELLGAITTEIIDPLMECPGTQDLYQTHLATLYSTWRCSQSWQSLIYVTNTNAIQKFLKG